MGRLVFGIMALAMLLPGQRLEPQVYSPLGRAFFAKPDAERRVEKADEQLTKGETAEAILAAAKARDDLQRFDESIPLYTRGMQLFPEDVRFVRFRGHRNISIRRIEAALVDLKLASEIAPASFDVSYHLGLAYYLRGDYNHAAREYRRCLVMAAKPQPDFMKGMPKGWRSCYAMNDDTRVSITDWLYKSLLRAGKKEETVALLAEIKDGMQVKENVSYWNALQFYKGLKPEEQVAGDQPNAKETTGYSLAIHFWGLGQKDKACEYLRRVVQGENWAAFGFIGAEGDMTRGMCPTAKKK